MLGLRFCARAFSSCGKRGHSSSRCAGLSLSWPLLLRSTGSRRAGSVVVLTGLVAPRHVASSQTRARTRVPCIGRQTLNHCATREAPILTYFCLMPTHTGAEGKVKLIHTFMDTSGSSGNYGTSAFMITASANDLIALL